MKSNILLLIAALLSASLNASPEKKQIQLYFTDTQSGTTDVTDIYMDKGLSTGFVAQEDVEKAFDNNSTRPYIYTFSSNNTACYSNGYGEFTQSIAIPVGFKVTKGGTYTLSTPELKGFEGTSIIRLEDKVTGQFADLRQGADTFDIATGQQTDNRFVLHVSFPPTIGVVESGCMNDDGVITLTQDNTITWSSVLLFNSLDSLIGQVDNASGEIQFNGLPQDQYSLGFVYGNYNTLKPTLLGTHQIVLNIKVSSDMAQVGEMLQFTSAALNTDEYDWEFGDSDSTRIRGVANPEFAYHQPGTYVATLNVSNTFNCIARSSVTINVGTTTSAPTTAQDKITFTVKDRNIIMNVPDYQNSTYTYELYNLGGQLLLTNPITSSNMYVSMDTEPSGIYLMNIKGRNGVAATRKLFVE